MGSSHQMSGLAEKADLHQGAQLCKILPLLARGGNWELARGGMRDPPLQRCRALRLGLRRQRSRVKAAVNLGEQKESKPTCLSFSHPLPYRLSPANHLEGGPRHFSAVREPALGAPTCLLVYSSLAQTCCLLSPFS